MFCGNQHRHDDPVLAELMEVFQIQRVVQDLVHVRLQDSALANLEFEAENDPFQKQNHVDSLPEPRDIILKNDLRGFVLIRRKNALQDRDFGPPCLPRRGQSFPMVIVAQNTKYGVFIRSGKRRKAAVV